MSYETLHVPWDGSFLFDVSNRTRSASTTLGMDVTNQLLEAVGKPTSVRGVSDIVTSDAKPSRVQDRFLVVPSSVSVAFRARLSLRLRRNRTSKSSNRSSGGERICLGYPLPRRDGISFQCVHLHSNDNVEEVRTSTDPVKPRNSIGFLQALVHDCIGQVC